MKFITAKGILEDGTPLSPEVVELRAELVEFLHKSICGNSRHSEWDRRNTGAPKCEEVGNFMVTKFELRPLPSLDLVAEGNKFDAQDMPDPIPVPAATAQTPVAASADREEMF